MIVVNVYAVSLSGKIGRDLNAQYGFTVVASTKEEGRAVLQAYLEANPDDVSGWSNTKWGTPIFELVCQAVGGTRAQAVMGGGLWSDTSW